MSTLYETHNWIVYTVAFIIAFFISLLFTPISKKLSLKVGAVDYPKERGLHKEPIPRMGGIAIVLGFLVAMLLLMPFVEQLRSKQFLGFFIGVSIIVVLGIFDDIYDLRAKLKFTIQMIAALVVVFTGTRINLSLWPFAEFLEPFSPVFTIFWIVGVTNAVNFIDGVDGLAAGVSSICSFVILVLCILTGSPLAIIFTSALAGSCLGFLPRNFSPAEIFMGDTGATFLGFVLAVSSIIGVFKSYALLAVVIAIFSMAFPILDTFFAMIRRTLKGQSVMQADRGHLHHRLIDAGYSHKQAVIILYSLSAITGMIAILIAIKDIYVLICALILSLVLSCTVYVYKKRMN